MFHGALLQTVRNLWLNFFFKRSFKEIASKFSLPTLHSFLWKSYDILNVYSSLISTTYLQTFTFFRNLIWQICSCILVLQRYVHVVLSVTLHATALVPQREIEESTPWKSCLCLTYYPLICECLLLISSRIIDHLKSY